MDERNLQSMTDLVGWCKRRGFLFQSSEIYGGLASCWDYGPLGVELKNNVKATWWRAMTYREDIEGLDASILMHPMVWQASGHIDHFSDPLVDCKQCKNRFRADKIDLQAPCPSCGTSGSFTEPREFNLMFRTQMGAVDDSSATVYLRPETAQGIFTNYLNVQSTMRKKLPFGIAQIGKAFRNEITPGHFIFRTREFEQMEMQYFINPGSQGEWMEKWRQWRWDWHLANGLRASKLRWKDHGQQLAHYADMAFDIEYEFPMGWEEMEGVHSRTDFDLGQHQKFSKKNLQYVDQLDGNKKFLPYVVETAVGCDRATLAILCDAYRTEYPGDREKERTVLRFLPHLAPIKVAVLPLIKKDKLEAPARQIFQEIQKDFKAEFDGAGSIGKRYRRQDEIGTPFCVTFDFDSLEDQAVTVRDRDTMEQKRIGLDHLRDFLKEHLQ